MRIVYEKEKSKMRAISLTDDERDAIANKCGNGSLTKGIRNMYNVVDILLKKYKADTVHELVKTLVQNSKR